MASWEPVDIDPIDRDGMAEDDDKWDDGKITEIEAKLEELRHFNTRLETSPDKDVGNITLEKGKVKEDTIELVAKQISDKITKLFNEVRKRLGIKGGANIVEPIRNYDSFDKDDNGNLTFVRTNEVIGLGNVNEGLDSPSKIIKKLGVNRLRLMGFRNITDEDIYPYRARYKDAREKVRKLNENLNERSKAIESSSTDAEAIEMIEMTSKDIDTTVKGVEQDTSFIKPDDKDKLLPLRELEGSDKQLRTIRGSLKAAIAKRIDLEGRIEHVERKLNEIQDPTYSDDQRNMRDKLNERNEEINILKDETSKQSIKSEGHAITKFLDKETGTLGERIRTLFKEQGITVVSMLTAVGMAIGVLIEALLDGPSVSTTTSESTISSDKKGGAREWIRNKLKALSQSLGKLADKANNRFNTFMDFE